MFEVREHCIQCRCLFFFCSRQRKKKERREGKTDTDDVLAELEKMKREMPGSDFVIGYKGINNDKEMEDVDCPSTEGRGNEPQKKESA